MSVLTITCIIYCAGEYEKIVCIPSQLQITTIKGLKKQICKLKKYKEYLFEHYTDNFKTEKDGNRTFQLQKLKKYVIISPL